MNCNVHPEREAVAGCVSCGNLVCDECAVHVGGKYHCKGCLARATTARSGPTVIERPAPALARRAPQHLSRSRSDALIGGVCGGLAQYLGLDASIVRLLTAVSLLSGVSIIVYLLAWVLIPLSLDRIEEAYRS